MPDALYEPLFARLRAGKNDVLVVEAAAVIGRNIDRALLRAVVDLDAAQVDEVIEQLTDAHVLEPWGGDNRRFRHELLREVASELAPPSVRRALHSKVADALVDTAAGDADWPLIAAHYERSARHADAATAYQQASGAARGRGALAEARTYLSRALTQVELCPPGPDRDRREIAPRLKRGYLTATAEGAQSPVAVADFERCLELVGTDLRDDEVVATLTAVGAYYLWRADLQRAGQVIAVAQAGAERSQAVVPPRPLTAQQASLHGCAATLIPLERISAGQSPTGLLSTSAGYRTCGSLRTTQWRWRTNIWRGTGSCTATSPEPRDWHRRVQKAVRTRISPKAVQRPVRHRYGDLGSYRSRPVRPRACVGGRAGGEVRPVWPGLLVLAAVG